VLQIVPGRGHTYGTVTWAGSAVIAFSARALNEVSPPGTVAISPHQGAAAVTGRGEVPQHLVPRCGSATRPGG
jgi:hypothetical protein